MGFKIDGIDGYINNAPMTGPIVGDAIDLSSHMGIAVQCTFTGTPLGEFKLQASCDLTTNPSSVTNWTDISSAQVSGASGSRIFNCRDIYYKWIRLTYSPAGGSGNLFVTYTVKGEW